MVRNIHVNSINSIAIAMTASMGLIGCMNGSEPTQTSMGVESGKDNQTQYENEVMQIKNLDGISHESALMELQRKYKIQPMLELPPNVVSPKLVENIEQIQSSEKSSQFNQDALKKVSGDIHSGLYPVKAVFIDKINMAAGATIELTTSGLSAGADPIVVLYRYTNQTHDFQATGIVNYTAQHKNVVYAWNDDYSGLGVNSKITFTSSDAGYYAYMVFAYSSGSSGTGTLTRRYKPANGSWTETAQNISITGQIVRYSGPNKAPTFMAGTDTYSTGSDPWIFFWDFGNMRGGDNDDRWSDARTSWLYNGSWYPASMDYNSKNCVIFTGYKDGGTATYSFYE